ncbi:hypothetical protein AMTR_s00079p00083420 [Amborella trichopoda]|uniref:Uncharacterized protein n=1 Tax=Amborella trichopoda TaxID=13333 RepID=W1PAC6_AMBTC|nr:hypothetical protein AMTR_s00079p00083420 [Amborella trichopoda]
MNTIILRHPANLKIMQNNAPNPLENRRLSDYPQAHTLTVDCGVRVDPKLITDLNFHVFGETNPNAKWVGESLVKGMAEGPWSGIRVRVRRAGDRVNGGSTAACEAVGCESDGTVGEEFASTAAVVLAEGAIGLAACSVGWWREKGG